MIRHRPVLCRSSRETIPYLDTSSNLSTTIIPLANIIIPRTILHGSTGSVIMWPHWNTGHYRTQDIRTLIIRTYINYLDTYWLSRPCSKLTCTVTVEPPMIDTRNKDTITNKGHLAFQCKGQNGSAPLYSSLLKISIVYCISSLALRHDLHDLRSILYML